MFSLTFVNQADADRHAAAAEFRALAEQAEKLAELLTAKLNDTFPVAEEMDDAADVLYVNADNAAGAIWQLSGLFHKAARALV